MRGKLHLKVMVNASPFYYGSMLFNYIPLNGFASPPIQADAFNTEFIPYSQMPHIWVYPSTNQGGEIVCPFFLHKPWLNIQSNSEVTNMGSLAFRVVNVLQSANGATGVGVYYTIYAWLEDVEFLGTTNNAVLQSEWGKGPVSKPASVISKALKNLSHIPVIGDYANATSMVSEGVGRMASLLGYSNPPEISNVVALKPQPFPQLASTEISTPVERLALDPKNEITIDPSIVGLPPNDEHGIHYLIQRESYLTSFNFSTVNVPTDILFRMNVTPQLFGSSSVSAKNFTPLCYVSNLFRYWKGDIIVRFKIVCTQYHKGRLLVMYDPSSSANTSLSTTTDSSTVFTQVLDMGQENDIEFRIPYVTHLAWLTVYNNYTANQYSSTGGSVTNPGSLYSCGQVIVRVLNPLTAPIAASTISVQVFVRAADNFEFAGPQSTDVNRWSPYTLETSDEIDYDDPVQLSIGDKPGNAPRNINSLCMGEKIVSLRQLLRRSTLIDQLNSNSSSSTTAGYTLIKHLHGRFPRINGFDPNGMNSGKGILVPGSDFPYNFVNNDYFSYISMMYIGMRGSVNWTYNVTSGDKPVGSLSVARGNDFVRSIANWITTADVTYTTANYSPAGIYSYTLTGPGASLTSQLTQAGLSVNVPWYQCDLFNYTDPTVRSLGSVNDHSSTDGLSLNIVTQPAVNAVAGKNILIKKWFSIGPDFSFLFFLCCPTLTYGVTTTPT